MTDYQRYINALRKCAKEHENDRTSTGHIIISDLCRDTANLLETLEQEPTTKNNLAVDCQYTDEEITKSFIEDVEAVKVQLPCCQQMDFPNTFDEFAKDYGFKDKDEVYTNGSELIPVFRVKQWLEHISTTKNNLEVSSELEKNSKKLEKNFGELDCISRVEVIDYLCKHCPDDGECFKDCDEIKHLRQMPSVTPQEPRCKDCKWWKDSDGEYRRGCGAESKCPINRREVFEGNGYCYMFEPQESEDKE